VWGNSGILIRQPKSENLKYVLSIYPNPTNGITTLKYDTPEGLNLKFIIYNSLGVKTDEYKLIGGKFELEFETEHLNPGIYHYVLYNNKERISMGKLAVIK